MKKNSTILITAIIFFVALFTRIGLNNTPFWVDEFSTAREAMLVMKEGFGVFSLTDDFFEKHNVITHFLVSWFFSIFGIGEWQARLPMMIIGSIVPVLIYHYTKKTVDEKSGLIASLLYIFSYLQITWSNQARGYVLQQLIILITLFLYNSVQEKFSKKKLILLGLIFAIGSLTHITYYLVIASLIIHFLLFKKQTLIKYLKAPLLYSSIMLGSLLLLIAGQLDPIITNIKSISSGLTNNLPYYHSFLWREQTIITLLAIIGVSFLIWKEKKYNVAAQILLAIALYLMFVCFLFAPYVSRYLLPIFPLLIILAGTAISKISEAIWNKQSMYLGLAIAFFIIANGDKFVLKPKAYYSVNHDMREIALIDYHKVYDLIKQKGNVEKGETAIIDTWPDRLKWYMGENKEYFYAFRWLESEGLVNGLPKRTNFELNSANEKVIPKTGLPAIKLIGELSDLEKAMTKYQYGFIWIDDASLPKDVIDYVKQNFKEELFLDHYPLDDNPYSIWPGTLYSWGFESSNHFFKRI